MKGGNSSNLSPLIVDRFKRCIDFYRVSANSHLLQLSINCDAYSGLFGCRSGIGFIDLWILGPDPKVARSADSTGEPRALIPGVGKLEG
jgi:hypothetical protein